MNKPVRCASTSGLSAWVLRRGKLSENAMMQFFVRLWRNSIVATFLAGLIMLLPIVLTIIIVAWIVNFLRSLLGPDSFLGSILLHGGTSIIGPGYDTFAFLLGVLIALFGIFFIGLAARGAAQRSIEQFIDRVFTKLPFIRAIYNPVSRMVRLTTDKSTGDFSSMAVVACRIGGNEGADVLALLANPEVFLIAGERRRMVYLPATPLPMSGWLVLLPESAVFPVPEMKVEDLLRIYFSVGALAPDAVPKYMKDGRLPFPMPVSPTVVTPESVAEAALPPTVAPNPEHKTPASGSVAE